MTSLRWMRAVGGCVVGLVLLSGVYAAQSTSTEAMRLVVDETQAARRLASVHEEIPVTGGLLELAYPKWIPGEHGPTGPLHNMANLRIRAGQAPIAWHRNPEDLYSFLVDIPAGASTLSLDFDVLLENTISDHQLLLAWNTAILYPRRTDKSVVSIRPSLVLPPGWRFGTSLDVLSQDGSRVDFAPVSLERLIDAPVLAGEFFRSVPLTSQWPAQLEITGDTASAVENADHAKAFSLFSRLVDEDRAMFGFKHFKTLHILISQSDARPFDGLEHAEAPFNALSDAALSKADQLEEFGGPLLAHELSHSWVGKYRRAAEMYSKPDYQGPERTSLLWVYEGLNQYVGWVLSTRAGFNDEDYLRDSVAGWAAWLSVQPARVNVPLVDTAIENWILRTVGPSWSNLRRGQDYYYEGALIWLRADVLIREQSGGRRSLDDFLQGFFGQRDTGPTVVPYTREEVEAGLSAVQPYDWHGFFERYVYQVNAAPPTDGLDASGWRLMYTSAPSRDRFFAPGFQSGVWHRSTIGIALKTDGTIADVLRGSAAYEAGLGPQMSIVSVNGQAFSVAVLDDAIEHPVNGHVVLLVKNFNAIQTREIQYKGGLRYPHLERIPGSRDYLAAILAPRAPKQP